MKKEKISNRALIARINRKLMPDEKLRVSRGPYSSDIGKYYITNQFNIIVAAHVNLSELGRELKVLHSGEELAED
ncbi:MAG: hypothetical protein JJT96_12440 [Opitutales bacterium]|nr:hypothetical protein [Opitutales bacterium]